MRLAIRCFLLIGVWPFCAYSQSDPPNNQCVNRHKLTAAQRSRFYPFDAYSEIRLVSFRPYYQETENSGPDIQHLLFSNEPGKIDLNSFDESVALTKNQVDSLTDIIYNARYKGKVSLVTVSFCYTPRNAILFLDSNHVVFAYIEICFECERTVVSSDRISLGDRCTQKIDWMKTFFFQHGIKIGTIDNDYHKGEE